MKPGKRVLVLGGTGALGQALLRELQRAGAELVFTWHSQPSLATLLQQELDCPALPIDLREADAPARLFADLAAQQRLPDVVVHCAGVAPVRKLDEISAGEWDDLQAMHGRAALLCAQQMQKHQCRGALVLVSALDGVMPVPAPAHYAASQAALWGLTQALARELGPQGILVNLAVVGVLEAGIAAALAPALRQSYQQHAALARTGFCAEIAKGLRWLALENSYLNGAQFPLTGGLA